MTILKVSQDGRITLPDEMRQSLGLDSGSEIEARLEGRSVRLFPVVPEPKGGVDIGPWLGKGRSFATQEEADAFLRTLRDEWD